MTIFEQAADRRAGLNGLSDSRGRSEPGHAEAARFPKANGDREDRQVLDWDSVLGK